MNMFSVMYVKGQLIAAMFLWNGATVHDCQKLNAQYAQYLPNTPLIKTGKLKLTDVKLACEWHDKNPVKNGVTL